MSEILGRPQESPLRALQERVDNLRQAIALQQGEIVEKLARCFMFTERQRQEMEVANRQTLQANSAKLIAHQSPYPERIDHKAQKAEANFYMKLAAYQLTKESALLPDSSSEDRCGPAPDRS